MERLFRSRRNRVLFGVCGGFAEYFHIDVTIIRIICLLIVFSGAGIPAYIIAALIIPDEGKASSSGKDGWDAGAGKSRDWKQEKWRNEWEGGSKEDNNSFAEEMKDESQNWEQPVKYNSERNRFVLGAILVGLGVLFLGRQIMPALFKLDYMVPLLLIGIGGFIVLRGRH